jgi:hypothetical protein
MRVKKEIRYKNSKGEWVTYDDRIKIVGNTLDERIQYIKDRIIERKRRSKIYGNWFKRERGIRMNKQVSFHKGKSIVALDLQHIKMRKLKQILARLERIKLNESNYKNGKIIKKGYKFWERD